MFQSNSQINCNFAMIKFKLFCGLTSLTLLALGFTGCATGDVNPSKARAHTGYVDFRAESSGPLNWQVSRQIQGTQNFTVIYSELSPPAGGVLRLAFAPGNYRLQITFLNRVVAEPGSIEVEVVDGRITPVQVTLTPAGTASVQQKEMRIGMKAGGFGGRKTTVSSNESVSYQVTAVTAAPLPYQPK
jgi:hypothetical protein